MLRDYQQQASDAAYNYFTDKKAKYNAIEVLPTGSGKSHIIADVAARLKAPILIFQPSKEILQQNFAKMQAVQPFGCSIYSASFNSKEIGMITFATIGSVKGHPELFESFKYVIVDECHSVNPRQGMYKDFFEAIGNTKILGLTATPYRLTSYMSGSMLKFITRTRPNVFSKVIYQVQVKTLLDMGYLAKLRYFQMNMIGWNADNLKVNSTGADYTDKSLIAEYERVGFYGYLVDTVKRLINPKAGRKPHGILVFTRFVKEAMQLTQSIQGCEIVTGETPKKERERILTEFKSGKIPVVANVGVLTCLSEDTEILTKRGWETKDSINENDMVAQYENEEISFEKPIRIIKKLHSSDFVKIDGRYMNLRITNDHNVIYRNRVRKGLGEWRKDKAINLVGKKVFIPVSGFSNVDKIEIQNVDKYINKNRFIATNSYNYRKKGMSYDEAKRQSFVLLEQRKKQVPLNPSELSIAQCRFIGFWLGDGSKFSVKNQGTRYALTQSTGTPNLCLWIENILKECNIKYSVKEYDGGISKIMGKTCKCQGYKTYSLSKGTGGDKQYNGSKLYQLFPYLDKNGSNLYWGLNREQYFALMEGLFKADGNHGDNKVYKGSKIIGEHKELFDLLQAIGVCRGFRVMVTKCTMRKNNKHQLYNISLADYRYHQLVNEPFVIEKNSTPQNVWCVTMPKGTIVTRRNGRVAILGNCGFDYPELDTIVMARPTMSLAMYYQIVGRAIRPFKGKEGWFVDLVGNIDRFGHVDDLRLEDSGNGKWAVYSNGKQLTNVLFQ